MALSLSSLQSISDQISRQKRTITEQEQYCLTLKQLLEESTKDKEALQLKLTNLKSSVDCYRTRKKINAEIRSRMIESANLRREKVNQALQTYNERSVENQELKTRILTLDKKHRESFERMKEKYPIQFGDSFQTVLMRLRRKKMNLQCELYAIELKNSSTDHKAQWDLWKKMCVRFASIFIQTSKTGEPLPLSTENEYCDLSEFNDETRNENIMLQNIRQTERDVITKPIHPSSDYSKRSFRLDSQGENNGFIGTVTKSFEQASLHTYDTDHSVMSQISHPSLHTTQSYRKQHSPDALTSTTQSSRMRTTSGVNQSKIRSRTPFVSQSSVIQTTGDSLSSNPTSAIETQFVNIDTSETQNAFGSSTTECRQSQATSVSPARKSQTPLDIRSFVPHSPIINEVQSSFDIQPSSEQTSFGSQVSTEQTSFDTRMLTDQTSFDTQVSTGQPSFGTQVSTGQPSFGTQVSTEQTSFDTRMLTDQTSFDTQVSTGQPSSGTQVSTEQTSFDTQMLTEQTSFSTQLTTPNTPFGAQKTYVSNDDTLIQAIQPSANKLAFSPNELQINESTTEVSTTNSQIASGHSSQLIDRNPTTQKFSSGIYTSPNQKIYPVHTETQYPESIISTRQNDLSLQMSGASTNVSYATHLIPSFSERQEIRSYDRSTLGLKEFPSDQSDVQTNEVDEEVSFTLMDTSEDDEMDAETLIPNTNALKEMVDAENNHNNINSVQNDQPESLQENEYLRSPYLQVTREPFTVEGTKSGYMSNDNFEQRFSSRFNIDGKPKIKASSPHLEQRVATHPSPSTSKYLNRNPFNVATSSLKRTSHAFEQAQSNESSMKGNPGLHNTNEINHQNIESINRTSSDKFELNATTRSVIPPPTDGISMHQRFVENRPTYVKGPNRSDKLISNISDNNSEVPCSTIPTADQRHMYVQSLLQTPQNDLFSIDKNIQIQKATVPLTTEENLPTTNNQTLNLHNDQNNISSDDHHRDEAQVMRKSRDLAIQSPVSKMSQDSEHLFTPDRHNEATDLNTSDSSFHLFNQSPQLDPKQGNIMSLFGSPVGNDESSQGTSNRGAAFSLFDQPASPKEDSSFSFQFPFGNSSSALDNVPSPQNSFFSMFSTQPDHDEQPQNSTFKLF